MNPFSHPDETDSEQQNSVPDLQKSASDEQSLQEQPGEVSIPKNQPGKKNESSVGLVVVNEIFMVVVGIVLALVAGLITAIFGHPVLGYISTLFHLLGNFSFSYLLYGALWTIPFLLVSMGIGTLLKKLGCELRSVQVNVPNLTVSKVLVIALFSGFCEEVLCRGIFQQWFGAGIAGLVFASALFAVLHLSSAKSLPYAMLTGLMGLAFGVTVLVYGSLWVPITMHVLNNVFAFGIKMYVQKKEAKQAAAV